jgi:oligopeptide/dipeptide ABC transporter ATP-binding protein
MTQPLLSVRDLKVHFPLKKGFRRIGTVYAVDGVSFDLLQGETLALVGESGCGKSTTGRTILRLEEATSGTIAFEGRDVRRLSKKELFHLRREMQIVFQDAYSCLNPRLTIGEAIAEPMEVHRLYDKAERMRRVEELLDIVGLNKSFAKRYPHECSGGQRQRIGIARALSLRPKLIVADEPVSALDVSVQSQVLNLFQDLKERFGLSYLFISHDLSVVRHVADRVAVMYLGKIVETGTIDQVFGEKAHPYTKALLSSVPQPEAAVARERIALKGEVPSPIHPPSGCSFHPRCPYATDLCRQQAPALLEIATGHFAACHEVAKGVSA